MAKELDGYLPKSVVTFGAAAYERAIYDQTTPQKYVPLLIDKALHTGRVFLFTQNLLERIDPEQAQFNWGLAGSMAYLHDIARPGELLGTGGYGISSTYNHGEEGRRMILEAELDLEGYPFTPEMIAVGVAHHSPRDVNGVSPELLPYIWLIRDADKLDNLLLVNGDYWAHLQSYAPHLVPSPAITPLVWRQFSDPRLVSIHNSHIRTFGDTLLFILGWFFELHFAETVEYLVRERVPERIFELMEDLGVEAVTIQEAKRVFSRQSGIQLREK